MTAPGLPARTLRLRPDDTAPLQALLVAAGPHLEPVVDVGSAANGDLLVELPPARVGLPGLLVDRERLDAGEAVTLLVPLAEALAAAHAAGAALGGRGVGAVRLTDDGAAYWAAPERPVLRRAVSEDDFLAATEADEAAFAALAAAVLGRAGIAPAAGWMPTVEALFVLAEPVPVRFGSSQEQPVRAVPPQRLVPPALLDPGPGRTAPAAALLARLRGALALVRRRVWAAAAGTAVLLVLAVVLLPGTRGDAGERAAPMLVPSRTATPSASARGVPRSAGPADAVRALLDARARLLASGDVDGLAAVEAPGSPVLIADRASIASGADPVRLSGSRVVVLSSGGGTALADVGGGTVLAVRQQNGWRLRDVVAEPPAG